MYYSREDLLEVALIFFSDVEVQDAFGVDNDELAEGAKLFWEYLLAELAIDGRGTDIDPDVLADAFYDLGIEWDNE